MSFPNPSPVQAPSDPSAAQRLALTYLQSGAPRFANPITTDINSIKDSLETPGGFPLKDISSIQTLISGAIPLSVDGADAINTQIQQYMGADLLALNQTLLDYKLTQLADVTPHIESVLEPTLSIQTARICDDMPKAMSVATSYSSLKSTFSDRIQILNANNTTISVPSTSPCEVMESVMGSLGGAADGLVTGVRDSIEGVTSAFAMASPSSKNALAVAVSSISTLLSTIRTDIAAWVEGGSSMFNPPNVAMFDDLKSSLASVSSGISDFMQSAAGNANISISSLTSSIESAADTIKTHVQDISSMIQSELTEFNKAIPFISDASLAMSIPNLSVCGKEVIKRSSASAGAVPITNLTI